MDNSKYIFGIIFMVYVGISLFVFFIIDLIFPKAFEFPLFYYWHYENILDGLLRSWPIFLWGFIVTLLSLILCNEHTLKTTYIWYVKYANDESSLFQCFIDSLLIGITEEMTYRWLIFYLHILTSKVMNYCLFGWVQFYYLNVHAPIINYIFLNKLQWLLYDQAHWSIGSAAIVANAKFRDQHIYLGFFGYFNSWCIGFFQFWIMINYGLPAAICSHTFYDFIIFSMYYIHGIFLRQCKYRHYSLKTTASRSALEETFSLTPKDSTSLQIVVI